MESSKSRALPQAIPAVPDDRLHLTEPTWLEQMILTVDEYLKTGKDTPPPSEKNPGKEAA